MQFVVRVCVCVALDCWCILLAIVFVTNLSPYFIVDYGFWLQNEIIEMKEEEKCTAREHDCCNNFNKISNWIQFVKYASNSVRFATTISSPHTHSVTMICVSRLCFQPHEHAHALEKKQNKIIKRLLTQACNLERVMNWKLELKNNSHNKYERKMKKKWTKKNCESVEGSPI